MAMQDTDRWEQIRIRTLTDPETRDRYDRTRRAVLRGRQVLQLIDAERQRAGLTKAELARRAGMHPAAVRRLLSSDSGNPTLQTLLEVSDVLGLDFTLKPVSGVTELGVAAESRPDPSGAS